jgi:hypothetical protein
MHSSVRDRQHGVDARRTSYSTAGVFNARLLASQGFAQRSISRRSYSDLHRRLAVRHGLAVRPVSGRHRPNEFTVTSGPITGRDRSAVLQGRTDSFNDLGEGIQQPLVMTCAIEGLATASGSAGLEWRRSLLLHRTKR